MLGCYPIAATSENWLHESLVSIIRHIHSCLDAGQAIQESQACWKEIVPDNLRDSEIDFLVRATGIRDRVFSYCNSISHLSALERDRILDVLENQNRVADLLSGACDIETIENQFPDVHAAAYDLFVFCFEKLTDFKVRKRQYQIIFSSLELKICSFCGIERVMNPEETAQDQDHYLAKSIYPFAAVNMKNLVPMCRCCNRDYKKAIDVIRDNNGVRRLAFDPYDCQPPIISLRRSFISEHASPPLPEWCVDFVPASEHAETWDSVFSIRARYKRDILNEYYGKWLSSFRTKCAKDRLRGRVGHALSVLEIRNVLAEYCEDKAESPNIGMAGFLEPLVFEFLLDRFDQGELRIVTLIRDSVLGTEMEVTV